MKAIAVMKLDSSNVPIPASSKNVESTRLLKSGFVLGLIPDHMLMLPKFFEACSSKDVVFYWATVQGCQFFLKNALVFGKILGAGTQFYISSFSAGFRSDALDHATGDGGQHLDFW